VGPNRQNRGPTLVTVDEFSRLVAGIYAAAVDPEHWAPALEGIRQTLDGTVGTLCQTVGGVWSIQATTASLDVGRAYAERYCHVDYVLAGVECGPVGVVRTGTEVVLPNRNSEFYTGWMRPNDLGDGLFVRLSGGPPLSSLIVASPERTESFDTPERLKLMSGLVVHLQQALRTQKQLAAAGNRSAQLEGALDRIRDGVIIIGPDCRVINVNSAGEELLRSNDGLHTQSGRVAATNGHADQQLKHALHVAITGGRSEVRSGQSFTCPRPSGKRPYVIHVMPLHRPRSAEDPSALSALILVNDPERETPSATMLLGRLYGLTVSEAEVAMRLTGGASLKQIADELFVSYETIRTHLQHAFDKTDTHRQADLVRLMLALSR
jgi:DNA-binding CsgD family transcriptional regulator/PAS domain-containing protein